MFCPKRVWVGALVLGCAQAAEPAAIHVDLAGQDPELVQALSPALARAESAPKDAGALIELATLLDANDFDAPAEAAWLRVCALEPASAKPWYHLGRVRERRGNWEPAIAAVMRALELASDYAPAHARLGRLLLEAGRLDEAEHALRRAAELDATSPAPPMGLARLALLSNQPAQAVLVLEPLRARLPREPYVNGLLARARAMQGDAAGAALALAAEEEAGAPSVRDPWQAEVQRRALGLRVRIERAKARLASGDPDGAWKELGPLEPRANELAVLDTQCQVLLALGRAQEVLARIERAPPEVRASSLLAIKRVQAWRALGDDERALAEVENEIARNPAHPNGHALRGEILFDYERHAEAIGALETARAHNDRSLGTAILLGRARAASGDLVGGLRALEEAAASFPLAPKPWAYRAELLALDGRVDEARASLHAAEERGLEPELVERVAARLAELAEEPPR